ncbi:MAG: DNA polymerase III subunit alpha [Paludibacteraceae bacterium]|nr:DNA polymerase III subunit alpha [Paludibacteraceae bacterium]
MTQFTHLHVHSHYSILDGMSKVPDLISKAKKSGMYAMALTDHGNMFGIKEFTDVAKKENGKIKDKIKEQEAIIANEESTPEQKAEAQAEIEKLNKQIFKPIIGVEAYCARRKLTDQDKNVKAINPETGREYIVDRSGWHLILLAKNKKGYQNLCKLVSIAWVEGNYGRPRIDKEILQKYHEGLIVSSACLGGEIDQLLIAGDYEGAKKSVEWFKGIFGDDYYLEIMRHKTDKPGGDREVYARQESINPVKIRLAQETGVKMIATNDAHFVEEEHGEAHDRLICLSTGKKLNEEPRMHYTKQEWLKTPEEMEAIFSDIPEALSNTMEIADKVEVYSIESGPIMPKFEIPASFGTEEEYRQRITEKELFDEFTQDEKGNVVLKQEEADAKIKKLGGYEKLYRIKLEADYLAKLTWEGATRRYGKELTKEQHDRICFELHVMKTMGFPGYFLIVMDYIRAAREELGVSVGPGRGSAAGSVVAYCLKITDVDPLKYDLLFERFLNPDRISLPDIDVDFDDDGRGKVLDWVTQKYGKEKVAHIITYGTMATKSSIADVGRVQDVPLPVVNHLKSLVPDKFSEDLKDEKGKVPKVNLRNCLKYVDELKSALEGTDENVSTMLRYASELEDTIRQIGIHACGVIIGADDLTNFAPISTVLDKDSNQDVMVTQYDGHVIESVGLIKMDFLGLKTLSIIKEALKNIEHSHGEKVNIDEIPIDDELTYKLYSEGATIGTFQFESPGMQKYLRELHPSVFEDLIAMNALYRPGPMDYIPTFIDRKLGRAPIEYDIPIMEKYLKDTYGVTVYQEQVMLLSRQLANFTRGESDTLRKAMGKKLKAVLDKLKPKFIAGGEKNGHDPKVLEKIWADWEKFASYAFNKSHATCYSWVAYQTAYLKAHYPADYMAANLTRSKDNITDITKFMDECKRMGIKVLSPDVNESDLNFTSNKEGNIRFGLAGVKGVGEGAVNAILDERAKNGNFKSVFDFVERVNLSSCNRKTIESLALAGAFDSLKDITREQFMASNSKGEQFSEVLVRYGNMVQADKASAASSLWGDLEETIEIKKPEVPKAEEWSALERLNRERELVGIYLSAHPLDEFGIVLKHVCNTHMADFAKPEELKGKAISAGGMVTGCRNGTTKKGNPFAIITIEDFSGAHEFPLFGNDFVNYGQFLQNGFFVYFTGSYQPKKYNQEEFEFKFGTISLLPEVKDRLIEKITIEIPEEHLDANFVSDFVPIVKDNPGNVCLYIKVREQETGMMVDLFSRTVKMNITAAVIRYLQEKVEDEILSFKIN